MGITFLYPTFLWALLFFSVPIIIHLFNFRRFKTVQFPNIELLKEIKEDSKKSRTLKNWLILFFRILFITFLVLAFAFPVDSETKKTSQRITSIYIDNSFSMDAQGLEGNKLNTAKSFADQLIQNLPANSKIHITTNDFLKKNQILYNKKNALDIVSGINPSHFSKSPQLIFNRQANFIKKFKGATKELFWVSDFQQLNSSILNNQDSLNINFCLTESQSENNISIDSIWFNSPIKRLNGTEELNVRITNHGNEAVKDLEVMLNINSRTNKQVVSIKKNNFSDLIFKYNVPNDSMIKGEVFIQDQTINYDNRFLFSYTLPKEQFVYLISPSANFKKVIEKIVKNDSSITLTSTTPNNINFGELKKQDLIILGELNEINNGLAKELNNLSKKGKSIAYFPSGNSLNYDLFDIQYNNLDSNAILIGSLHKAHPFFSGVFIEQNSKKNNKEDYPTLFKHYSLTSKTNQPPEVIIFKEDGSPFLIKSGNQFYFAAGITKSNSNISQRALAIPLFYQMLFNAVQTNASYHFIQPNLTRLSKSGKIDKIILKNQNNQEAISRSNTNLYPLPNNFLSEGFFKAYTDNKLIESFALNYNRKESIQIKTQLEHLNTLAKKPFYRQIKAVNRSSNPLIHNSFKETSYWHICLIISFIFLCLEMIAIRIKK